MNLNDSYDTSICNLEHYIIQNVMSSFPEYPNYMLCATGRDKMLTHKCFNFIKLGKFD